MCTDDAYPRERHLCALSGFRPSSYSSSISGTGKCRNCEIYRIRYHRPVHPFPSVADIIQSIPASAACFAKLDATHGYFQIPLDEEASKLTTFILPSGRYRYLRAPMGLSSSSDEWCRHSDRVVEGFPWCRKIVGDILIWATSPSELENRISQVVQRCEKLHVTLSKLKFQVDTCLNFAGCVVSPWCQT